MAENNIKFLELATDKVSKDKDFMAYFLKCYQENENLSTDRLILSLKCTVEDYYKLALCRVPNMNADDFVERLNKISDYSNTSAIELNKIIKAIGVNERFGSTDFKGTSLLAARDKYSSDEDTEEDSESNEQENS